MGNVSKLFPYFHNVVIVVAAAAVVIMMHAHVSLLFWMTSFVLSCDSADLRVGITQCSYEDDIRDAKMDRDTAVVEHADEKKIISD